MVIISHCALENGTSPKSQCQGNDAYATHALVRKAYGRYTMNKDTEKFIENPEFKSLHEELAKKHPSIKPKWESKILEEIGRTIVLFQRMESTIHSFIGIFLNLGNNQKSFHIVTNKLTFTNSTFVLLNLAREKNFHRVSDLELVLNRACEAEQIRNQIVHSVWSSGSRIKKTLEKKGLIYKLEQYKIGDIQQVADQIDRVDTSIAALQFEYISFCHENGG